MFRNNDVSDGGRPILIEAPDDPVISLADCKKAIGISDASQDKVIEAAIAAVAGSLDPASNGWLGRALRPQTWELQLLSFNDRRCSPRPHHNLRAIPLPYPPLISVTSVKYIDLAGGEQALALGTGYRVLGMGQPFSRQAIAPIYAGAWPVTRVDDAAVKIRFTCGYDDDVNVMPAQLKQAVCLSVRDLLPQMSRDITLFEDRVEGIGSKRYQNNPEFSAIVQRSIGALLANLAIS